MGTLLEARRRLLIERLEAFGIQEAAFGPTSAAIIIRVPSGLANKLPKRDKVDPNPPHISVLIVGDTSTEEWETVKRITAQIAATTKPFRVSMDQYAEFHARVPEPMTIPHMRVRGSMLPQLHALLWARIAEASIKVGHRYGSLSPSRADLSHFEAHVTLGFLDGDHVKYEGPKPTGGWTVSELGCWRGTSTKTTFKLGRPDVTIVPPKKKDEDVTEVVKSLPVMTHAEVLEFIVNNVESAYGYNRIEAADYAQSLINKSRMSPKAKKALRKFLTTVAENIAPEHQLEDGAPIRTGGWVHMRKPPEGLTEHVVSLDALREGTLKVDVDSDEGAMRKMLDHIQKIAGHGHGFPVVVDPDDKEYRKEFYFDGDGPFKMDVSEDAELSDERINQGMEDMQNQDGSSEFAAPLLREARRLKFNARQREVLDALAHATEPGGNRPTDGASISSLVMFTDLTKAQVDRTIGQIIKKSDLLGPWGDGLISWNADSPSKARKLWTGWLRYGKTPPTAESVGPMRTRVVSLGDLRESKDAVLKALSALHKTAVASMSSSPLAKFAHTMTVITPKDIAAETGLNVRAVRRRLKQLEADGKVRTKVRDLHKTSVRGGANTRDTWAPL